MATDASAIQRRITQAKELAKEIRAEAKKGISAKEMLEYLKQKDEIVTTGQHHAERNVTAGQIAGDLDKFVEDMEHKIKETEEKKKEAPKKKK